MNNQEAEAMLRHPFDYISDAQKVVYRHHVIKVSLLLIAFSIAVLFIDIICFSYFKINFGAGFGPNSTLTESTKRFNEGASLVVLMIEFVVLPYGIYRLITLRRQMRKLAIANLTATNKQLQQYVETIRAQKNKKLQSRVNTTSNAITKIYITLVIISVIAAVGFIIFALIYR